MNERNSAFDGRFAGWERPRIEVPALLGLLLSLLPVSAEAWLDGDKSRYHLFRPTPADQMRGLSTDRPDLTESPYTVDTGHFQVELDFANGVLDRDRSNGGDVRSQLWSFAPVNFKVGLLNSVDIQFVLDSYVWSRVENSVTGVVAEDSGVGEVQTRLKINLWGNDGGATALAIMPFVKWPLPASSLRNGKTEGGVIIPLAIELPHGWGMGVMTELDFVRNAANDGYDTESFNTITFSHEIVGNLGGYLEFAALVSSAGGTDWQGQLDVGFTYGLNENLQFDFGCNFGVTESAPDFNPFIGLSWRL